MWGECEEFIYWFFPLWEGPQGAPQVCKGGRTYMGIGLWVKPTRARPPAPTRTWAWAYCIYNLLGQKSFKVSGLDPTRLKPKPSTPASDIHLLHFIFFLFFASILCQFFGSVRVQNTSSVRGVLQIEVLLLWNWKSVLSWETFIHYLWAPERE